MVLCLQGVAAIRVEADGSYSEVDKVDAHNALYFGVILQALEPTVGCVGNTVCRVGL